MHAATRNSISVHEVLLIIAIFAGWFMFSSVRAVFAGFPEPRLSDNQALGLALFEVIAFAVAVAVLWARGWRLKDFSFRISWWRSFVGVLLFGVTLLVHLAAWELVGPRTGASDFLMQFARAISLTLPVAILVSVVNGAFEEFFLTRYLIETLAKLGAAIALGVSALVRVMCHLYQGPLGALSILGFGLVLTVFYWRYRELWPAMFAHMVADFVAFA